MRTKHLSAILLLFFCAISFTNCDNGIKDDGSRGFMHQATVIGDPINGYYCYLDGGGFGISYDQGLDGIERGYFAFYYNETDWKTANNQMYIDNVRVSPYTLFDVIHPISIEEAESKRIIDKDSCSIPRLFALGHGYRGYFDIHTGLSIVNLVDLEKVPIKQYVVYDLDKLTPDTLSLQFCYNLQIPEKWSNTTIDYGTVSCDISSFASLQQWSDSVTIILDVGDEAKHWTKISKNDFLKPETKVK